MSKEYKFIIEISEKDLEGDEFWEDALKEDETGIKPLKDAIVRAIFEASLIQPFDIADSSITLIEYSNK